MEEVIVNCARVDDCEYWKPHDGEYWQGFWEFNDVCFKYKHECFCKDKMFCPHKIKFWIKHPLLSLDHLIQYIEFKIIFRKENK